MKKTTIGLILLATIAAGGCRNSQIYMIKEGGIGSFLIGQNIPAQADGYSITKSIEMREEEGEEFEVLIYTVSEKGEDILNIEPGYNYNAGDYTETKIEDIYILSSKYKTAKQIGLHSTIEEFIEAYPDYTIWYSYISNWYVIETKQLNNIQFFLDKNDFIKEGGPEFESDMTILKPSEFKKGSKIKEIRIWGYTE